MTATETTDRADTSRSADSLDRDAHEELADTLDIDDAHTDPTDEPTDGVPPVRRRSSPVRTALIAGLVMVVGLGAMAGWLGYRFQQAQRSAEQRAEFVQVARQGAVNLTTIDWEHADADVQRILDSATGTFYDDFAKRSGPFVEVVKQVKSKSEGSVSMAGLESVTGDQAQVLVAVSVKTTNAGAPETNPRAWRMRLDVQKVGNDVKVANVEFVP